MNNALAWLKSNPVTSGAIAVALGSLLVIVAVMFWLWPGLVADVEGRSSEFSKVERFMNQTITLPGKNVGDPPQTVTRVTYNRANVDVLKTLYDRLADESKRAIGDAVSINQRDPMVDGLFKPRVNPGDPPVIADSQRQQAKQAYAAAFNEMLAADGKENLPHLNASPPLTQAQLDEQLEPIRERYASRWGSGTPTPAQIEEYREQLRSRLAAALAEHARSIKLYAATDAQPLSPEYPFDVKAWALAGQLPSPTQLWEGQTELWIQADMARAIERVNGDASSVLDAPVKKLVRMEVLDGYVGVQTAGGIDAFGTGADSVAVGGFEDEMAGTGGAAPPGPSTPGGPDPGGPMAGPVAAGGPAAGALSRNFYLGPTGLASNPLFDVKHARLEVLMDRTQVPALLDAVTRANLVTVIAIQVDEVDDYALMQDLYQMGNADVVKVTLLVESLWLREWTAPRMPGPTRLLLGVDQPTTGPGARPTGRRF